MTTTTTLTYSQLLDFINDTRRLGLTNVENQLLAIQQTMTNLGAVKVNITRTYDNNGVVTNVTTNWYELSDGRRIY